VLVVEDDAMIALAIEHDLRAMGCIPLGPATTLDEALRLAASEQDLAAAVVDLNLRGREAFLVAEILQARERCPTWLPRGMAEP
jgi:CheY-like chemotaxis protein